LRDGERVVTSNQFRLEAGTRVKASAKPAARVAQFSELARVAP